ncbi:MAG: hypothetical protein HYT80_03860 [Euryarchaeota archaeon]|nr:hypothetical protein [Euryarchaeota archaeon]
MPRSPKDGFWVGFFLRHDPMELMTNALGVIMFCGAMWALGKTLGLY